MLRISLALKMTQIWKIFKIFSKWNKNYANDERFSQQNWLIFWKFMDNMIILPIGELPNRSGTFLWLHLILFNMILSQILDERFRILTQFQLGAMNSLKIPWNWRFLCQEYQLNQSWVIFLSKFGTFWTYQRHWDVAKCPRFHQILYDRQNFNSAA